jgi:hypothetical protein
MLALLERVLNFNLLFFLILSLIIDRSPPFTAERSPRHAGIAPTRRASKVIPT